MSFSCPIIKCFFLANIISVLGYLVCKMTSQEYPRIGRVTYLTCGRLGVKGDKNAVPSYSSPPPHTNKPFLAFSFLNITRHWGGVAHDGVNYCCYYSYQRVWHTKRKMTNQPCLHLAVNESQKGNALAEGYLTDVQDNKLTLHKPMTQFCPKICSYILYFCTRR